MLTLNANDIINEMWEKIWHGLLRRPYRLAKSIDTGAGQLVVLLHGIGQSSQVWQHVVEQLAPLPYRVVAFDLLGFGRSPKPVAAKYDIDDHARAVLASIDALRVKAPIILVGHSMGCLVAVRTARLRPDLAKHLVLYEMPLYEGLPQKRMYRLRLNVYYNLYDRVIRYQPSFDPTQARLAEKIAGKVAGFEAKRASWQPFVKSLQNTIMQQTAAVDLKYLTMPIDVIYGLFDMLVIRGRPRKMFGKDNGLIRAHTVRARHVISVRASRFIVERIEAAEHPELVQDKTTRKIFVDAQERFRRIAQLTR